MRLAGFDPREVGIHLAHHGVHQLHGQCRRNAGIFRQRFNMGNSIFGIVVGRFHAVCQQHLRQLVTASKTQPQQQHQLLIDFVDLGAQRRDVHVIIVIFVRHVLPLNNIELRDTQGQRLAADIAKLNLRLGILAGTAEPNDSAFAKA